MSQQQHLRLRPVGFPLFPVYTESTTHDIKTGYRSYSRVQVDSRDQVVFPVGEAASKRLDLASK